MNLVREQNKMKIHSLLSIPFPIFFHAFSPGTLSLSGQRQKRQMSLQTSTSINPNIALAQRKLVLNYALTVKMTDNLEPLSVEQLNVAVNKAVNAAFLPQGFTQKTRYANVFPGELI